MNLIKIILLIILTSLLISCADYKTKKKIQDEEKTYYSSHGFALIYSDNLYAQKVINKKLNNKKNETIHDLLKTNTNIQIINPINSKFVETKVLKKSNYPKIFNIVISQNIASLLELDTENPYVEVIEIKKNKKFIAKEANIFEEEKNVAEKAPVEEIKMDVLTKAKNEKKKESDKTGFVLIISDFYYEISANNLRLELIKKTKMDNIFVKKINNKKYRLFMGPFKNFNALKTSYISLNNLGFEDLNIYRE
jgi:hypothetical protein